MVAARSGAVMAPLSALQALVRVLRENELGLGEPTVCARLPGRALLVARVDLATGELVSSPSESQDEGRFSSFSDFFEAVKRDAVASGRKSNRSVYSPYTYCDVRFSCTVWVIRGVGMNALLAACLIQRTDGVSVGSASTCPVSTLGQTTTTVDVNLGVFCKAPGHEPTSMDGFRLLLARLAGPSPARADVHFHVQPNVRGCTDALCLLPCANRASRVFRSSTQETAATVVVHFEKGTLGVRFENGKPAECFSSACTRPLPALTWDAASTNAIAALAVFAEQFASCEPCPNVDNTDDCAGVVPALGRGVCAACARTAASARRRQVRAERSSVDRTDPTSRVRFDLLSDEEKQTRYTRLRQHLDRVVRQNERRATSEEEVEVDDAILLEVPSL